MLGSSFGNQRAQERATWGDEMQSLKDAWGGSFDRIDGNASYLRSDMEAAGVQSSTVGLHISITGTWHGMGVADNQGLLILTSHYGHSALQT